MLFNGAHRCTSFITWLLRSPRSAALANDAFNSIDEHGRRSGLRRGEPFDLPDESRRLVEPEQGIVGAKVREFEQLAVELVIERGTHKGGFLA